MKIGELISAIEIFAAPELQEEYDNAGLITGNADWDCSGVLCCLDVTDIITAFKPDRSRTLEGIRERRTAKRVKKYIQRLISDGIVIYIGILSAGFWIERFFNSKWIY